MISVGHGAIPVQGLAAPLQPQLVDPQRLALQRGVALGDVRQRNVVGRERVRLLLHLGEPGAQSHLAEALARVGAAMDHGAVDADLEARSRANHLERERLAAREPFGLYEKVLVAQHLARPEAVAEALEAVQVDVAGAGHEGRSVIVAPHGEPGAEPEVAGADGTAGVDQRLLAVDLEIAVPALPAQGRHPHLSRHPALRRMHTLLAAFPASQSSLSLRRAARGSVRTR